MSATLALVGGPFAAALLVAAVGYAVLAAEKRSPVDVDSPVPYWPADDLMAIADAVQNTEGDAFDQWLADEVARSATADRTTVDELARRREGRSVR